MKQTILVTGAAGFLGSHLTRALARSRTCKVVILKRTTTDCTRIADLLQAGIPCYNADVESDWKALFQKHRIHVIVHLATAYGRSANNSAAVLESNLLFPIKLLEHAIAHGVGSFINTDSFFNKTNLSYKVLFDYSLSKKSLLLWLHNFSSRIKIVNVVLEHVYGEHDNPHKFVEGMIRAIAVNRVPSVALTHGHQRRDFIYCADVVSAYTTLIHYCAHNRFHFKEFNVGTGASLSVREMVELIRELSGSHTRLKFGAIPYRDDEIMNSFADNVDLLNLGWRPRHSLQQGVQRIIHAYTSGTVP